uniref:Uncharacterized protein n=1 Tax=Parascaris equorum TaxID=6256 RepID=A0A914RAQ1_PAREQ
MKVFPHVEELYMTCNGLECFDPGAHGLNLTLLDLEANPINDFSNLHNLSVLPSLEMFTGCHRIVFLDGMVHIEE